MISFYKFEGTGNDFIMINNFDGNINLEPSKIIRICDRHFGIGADGVILVEKSNKSQVSCFMNYYNSDGTIAEMCGNGIRCTAKFYIDFIMHGLKRSDNLTINIDTRAGIKKINCFEDDTYSVDMGIPIFESSDFPTSISTSPTGGEKIEGFEFNFVSMGNPHAVTIVSKLDDIDIRNIGPKIENNILFPNKINVEFVEKIRDDYYKVKVWERGCGETLSCGTGACAVFAILDKKENFRNEIILEFPGGKLYLSKNHENHIVLRGLATFVFKGEIK
jgi:diaminopimelate epimerase